MTFQILKEQVWRLFNRPRRFFVFVFFICGLPLVFITPPFQAPDEGAHLFRIYQISQGQVFADRFSDGAGGWVPRSFQTMYTHALASIDLTNPDSRYDFGLRTQQLLGIVHNANDKVKIFFNGSAIYSPVTYIPQSFGMGVSSIFQAPPLVQFYTARVFNLLVFGMLLLAAIRLLPVGKWLLALLALLPMTLFQAASLSADAMTLGLVALLAAYVARLCTNSAPLTRKQLVLLAFITIGLALCKQTFLVLAPLVFLPVLKKGLPTKERRRRLWWAVGTTGVTGALALGWLAATKHLSVPRDTTVDMTAQLHFILDHPLNYLETVARTFWHYGGDYAAALVGNLGWLNLPLPWPIIVGFYLILLASLGLQYTKERLFTKWQTYTFIGVSTLNTLAVVTALYLTWTPVGVGVVLGLQGRYFLPSLLTLVPLLGGTLRVAIKPWWVTSAFFVLSIGSILYILMHYHFGS